jgi:hypothetical protein
MASRTTSLRVAYWPEMTACFIYYSISGADIERGLCSLMASRIASLGLRIGRKRLLVVCVHPLPKGGL